MSYTLDILLKTIQKKDRRDNTLDPMVIKLQKVR
jgi:hypothetical protein